MTRRTGWKSNKEPVMIEEDLMLTRNMQPLLILKEIALKLMVTTFWAKSGLRDTNALMILE